MSKMTQCSTELDWDERKACEVLAHDDLEVSEAIYSWALLSIRGRSRQLDEAFCDRLERLLSQALYRAQQAKDETEGLPGKDEHERLEVGA